MTPGLGASPHWPPIALDFGHCHADHFGHGTFDLWSQPDAMTGVCHFDRAIRLDLGSRRAVVIPTWGHTALGAHEHSADA
jgi:hypothetical protein